MKNILKITCRGDLSPSLPPNQHFSEEIFSNQASQANPNSSPELIIRLEFDQMATESLTTRMEMMTAMVLRITRTTMMMAMAFPMRMTSRVGRVPAREELINPSFQSCRVSPRPYLTLVFFLSPF